MPYSMWLRAMPAESLLVSRMHPWLRTLPLTLIPQKQDVLLMKMVRS